MAIAPLEQTAGERSERAGRSLRLIEGGRLPAAPRRGTAIHARPDEVERSRRAHPASVGREDDRTADEVRARLARARTEDRRAEAVRARTLARRRRTLGVVVSVAAVALLALPIRALGAVTVAGQASDGGAPVGLAPGSVYVVQQGDTVRSIAARINPGEVTTIAHELVASLGTSAVVPGEHVVVP